MRKTHMSNWDQEEYALGQRTPEMIQHLRECDACRHGVEQLEQGVALFRDSAMEWSAQCVETRLQTTPAFSLKGMKPRLMPAMKWAMAAVLILLVLLPLSRLLLHRPESARIASPASAVAAGDASLGDDALLQEVDEQVSEEVPDSMESLRHLVTTKSGSAETQSTERRAQHVQQN